MAVLAAEGSSEQVSNRPGNTDVLELVDPYYGQHDGVERPCKQNFLPVEVGCDEKGMGHDVEEERV